MKEEKIKNSKKSSLISTTVLGFYLFLLTILLLILLLWIWPEIEGDDSGNFIVKDSFSLFGFFEINQDISYEVRIILLVLIAGALGSNIHATTSFITYVGNNELKLSWLWWYIFRPFIGSSLAILFYFLIRVGLLTAYNNSEGMNIFGIAGISGLIGMFSKQAVDKLRELFDNLFNIDKKGGDKVRKDKLDSNNTE